MKRSIFFTRATKDDRRWIEDEKTKAERERARALSGEEAKNFYLTVTEDEGLSPELGLDETRKKRKRRKHGNLQRPRPADPQQSVTCERDSHRLLRCAQDGDVKTLEGLLGKGHVDVNFRDGFYWTAMMCASYAGRLDAVKVLLRRGAAWVGVVDTQGRDARDLADQAGHDAVVRELEEYGSPSQSAGSRAAHSVPDRQWCPACECHYTQSEACHRSSTLHQFSLARPPAAPQYCLPPSSAGYRMMLRSGWDPASGLGPGGEGRKQPVRTVLKRDQAGLGYGAAPSAKVTHFPAGDARAVQRLAKGRAERRAERGCTLTTKALKRKEQKDRNWERDFRSSFNIDL
ncbi:G patch domain and ankyrin repeat-containing protein 1 [Denticeps clupeoides]|uniref:G-patch domain-containing protein n=1 Tax=Denticeps clupeoides TaxID=299321 RepID=A0AAY4BCZ6_9TELE|nr:G patch domain and ankyrin repeat-containing protein 1 [Denticeps clupeoides]XP_028828255.1 G patch domain and ankyrin repeat-containing protein 1 [Denticeps clupeoides]